MHYPHLFEPLQIGSLAFSNRIVVPPLVTCMATHDGMVTRQVLDHYAGYAGAGLVIVEASAVAPEGRLAKEQIGVFEDRHVEGLTKLASLIHTSGAKAAIQIHHAGRQTSTEATLGLPLVAPSAFNSKRASAREMTEEEIGAAIEAFAAAARRGRTAGFDAVEVHGAHGYLVSQFLSPLANKRADKWGGSLENRARFLRQVFSRVRAEGLPAWCRLGVADGEPGGLSLKEGIEVARMLKTDGALLLHVSSGIGNPPAVSPEGSPYSHRFHLGVEVKKAIGIPVIAVGDIKRPEEAETAIAKGMTDLVAIGRGFLVDQLWAVKAREGRAEEIVACRSCKVCHRYFDRKRCPARKTA